MPGQQIMDIVATCGSFPESPKLEIPRDSSIDAIEDMFKNGVQVVVVEGEDGVGKTTLLSQFARRYPNHTFSLFIISTSQLGYHPDTLREDLCTQLEWALYQRDLEISNVDDKLLRIQLNTLKNRVRTQRTSFYFVIDGLDEVPSEGIKTAIFELLDMLPWGFAKFHFLLSGNYDEFSTKKSKKIKIRSYRLIGFRPDETKNYLGNLIEDADSRLLDEIHRTCRGIPGWLIDVRRNLETGMSAKIVLDNLSNLFEIEWERVDTTNALQLKLLGLMAFSHSNYSLDDFVRIMGIESSTVDKLLKSLSFVKYHESGINFVSNAFQKYVADKLKQIKGLKSEITDIIIDDLFRTPDNQEAWRDIPIYLEQQERYDDLLEYLSPRHCTRVLENSQTLSLVQQHLDLGMNTALKRKKWGEFVRFSVQKSIIAELDGVDAWRSEIEARLALKDYDTALALAYSTTLKQDRLRLLAIIAKNRQDYGLASDQDLMEQIRLLFDQIDFSSLGKYSIDIASDLIYTDQELAIRIVEQATKSDTDDSSDWAFAGLSVAASSAVKEQKHVTDTMEVIQSRIKDPEARRFSSTVSLMLGDYPAPRVISEVKKLEDTGDQLFLLRLWAMENRERKDAAEVVDFAYNLAISHTAEKYVPTRDLRAIATPLPFIEDKSKIKDLVGKFNGQLGITERYGPTEDHIRLQLLLAWAESIYDFNAARQRIEEIYYFVSDIEDMVVRTECLARLSSTLVHIDPDKYLEGSNSVHTLVEEELKNNISELLGATAEHFYATRRIIKALAKTKPAMALELAMQLNTEARRDKALLVFIESAIQLPANKLDLVPVQKALESLVVQKHKGVAILKIITRLATLSEKKIPLPESLVQLALQFINAISEIQDAQPRCDAYCLAYVFLSKQNQNNEDKAKYSGLASNLLNQLDKTWSEIDVKWIKVDVGFNIAKSLAEDAPEKAQEYLTLAKQARGECTLDAESSASTYLQSLKLTIRAYVGLLPQQLDTPEDFEELTKLIANVPSYGEQAGLWGDIALRMSLNERLNECEKIVTQHIKPLLAKISKEDIGYRTDVIVTLAPVLYRVHSPTALAQISELSQPAKDRAYAEICKFLLRQQPPNEPYDALPGKGYNNLTYESIISVCELLNEMDRDWQIYGYISAIADSIMSARRNRLSNEQILDIASRFERIISSKLPDPTKRHITHNGYEIIARAEVIRIRKKTRDKPRLQEWLDLAKSARSIPNLADKSLVLFTIATVMPSQESQKRKEILDEAMELVEQIPIAFDKIGHYDTFAHMVYGIDRDVFKKCIKSAMTLAIKENETPEYFTIQRRIIDFANKIDEDFATSLAHLVDDDPARANVKENIRDHLQLLKLKKQMAELSPVADLPLSSPKDDFSKVAWMNLGALNAGRISPVHIENTFQFVRLAAGLSLDRSYPILAFVIENAVQRLAKTGQAITYLRPMYEAMLIGTKLSERMATRSAKYLEQAISYTVKSPNNGNLLILSGEREKAIEFIRNWFANKVQNYLKIHDPYFSPDDLEILRLLSLEKPNCRVQILTSKEHQEKQKVSKPWEKAYRTSWRILSEQDPPDTDIVIIGTKSGKSPIHDRWWLTENAGIRIGTSINGLGGTRISEISELSQDELQKREKLVDQYLFGYIREYNGEKLFRWQFPLLE